MIWNTRPITVWPGKLAVPYTRQRARFNTRWSETLMLLDRELRHLGARDLVFFMAYRPGDIRLDGQPRATARPDHPGVIVAFQSRYGPLQYATDTYLDWQDNVRAIALGLEALRKVDRYGISKRGEQYTGYRALTAAPGDDIATVEDAMAWVAKFGGVNEALKATHPDTGGNRDDLARSLKARDLLQRVTP